MNRPNEKCFWSSVIGFFAVCISGTVSHYLYQLSGGNFIVGLFTPVNESIWEHLKLLFFPYLFYIIAEQIIYGRQIKGFLFSRTVGVICEMIIIPALYYSYTAFTGKSYIAVDILIFVISVMASFIISFCRIIKHRDTAHGSTATAVRDRRGAGAKSRCSLR